MSGYKTNILNIKFGLEWETSYGSPHSKICNWIKIGKENKYDKSKGNNKGVWFRLSVGFNDTFENVTSALLSLKAQL